MCVCWSPARFGAGSVVATLVVLAIVLGGGSGLGCGDDDDGEPDGAVTECGNDVIEAGERCDGADLGDEDCISFGWFLGTVSCAADCTFDVSGCVGGGPECGNWVVEWGEQCDTSDLGGGTCESVGMSPGTLACKPDCTFDRSGCGSAASCGNGIVDGVEGVEECDGNDLADQTCESRGYMGGVLACGSNCIFNEAGCTDPDCGNGVLETGEQCDGQDFGPNEDCVTFGHSGGELLCTSQCIVDTSACTD
jgi:hypothetical protein